IQFGGSLKARNEVPIGFSSGWRPDDSEIDPFTRRRSFKLKIARGIRKVRCEKDLTHVTVPEPQRLPINPRIFRGYQPLFLCANEANVKRRVRPADSHFSMACRRSRLSRPVMIDFYRLTALPGFSVKVSLTERVIYVLSNNVHFKAFRQSAINRSGSSLLKIRAVVPRSPNFCSKYSVSSATPPVPVKQPMTFPSSCAI